jgi:tetratricopeptide (TPR) repeat protein
VLLALAVWAVFGQTLRFDFVNYDDNRYVYENPVVKNGLTLENIGWAFTHNVASNWHPLTVISYMADASLYGTKPAGYHLTNVLLHALTAVLLFVVLNEMTGALWRSAFVAAVFAIHPLRVESVAWVSERKDVLSGVFFMLTLLCYVKAVTRLRSEASARQARGKGQVTGTSIAPASFSSRVTCHLSPFYWLALLFFALGLMSKPMLVTLPFVLLLLDYWPLGRFTPTSDVGVGVHASTLPRFNASTVQRLLVEKIPFFALSAAFCLVTLVAQQQSGAMAQLARNPPPDPLGNVFVSYARYLGKTFWPAGLAGFYPYPGPWSGEQVVLAVVLFAGLGAAALALGRRFPYVAVGWFWFVGMLIPVIGLVQVGSQSMADRYTYLPQIGLCLMVVWGVAELCGAWRWRRWVLGAAGGTVLAGLMAAAFIQTGYWQDSISLWQHSLACTSENYIAHYNLGTALADQGKWEEAIDQFQRAFQLAPGDNYVRIHLANALFKRGQRAEAIQLYERALELHPDSANAHSGLGVVLAAGGDIHGAIQHYNQALQLDADSVEAHSGLGAALAAQGNWAQALQHCERAVQLAPDQALPQMNLGNVLAMQGKMAKAIPHFERALELQPDYAEAHNNLGHALAMQGNWADAIKHYQQALQLKPNFAQAHYYLGIAFASQGKADQAISQFQQALDLATAQGDPRLANAARAQLQQNPAPPPQLPTP